MRILFLLAALVPLPAQERSAWVIPIQGEIDRSLTVFLRRQIQAAAADEPSALVFVIDTFGGRVDSALQIATLIGAVEGSRTVAFVPSEPGETGVSWSAGALIALSCSRIYMAPGTSLGAAAPVVAGPGEVQAADEKTVSALRAQMAALAEKNGYPVGAALAMVDADVELLEAFVGGERRLATADEWPTLERETRESGLTLERGRVVSPRGKLLTLTAGEMERYGLSSGTVAGLPRLLERLEIPAGRVTRASESAADRLVAFLTGSALTTLLVVAGLVALYLEITSPGFGLPGTVALICFAIVFLGGALLGTVGSMELLVFLAGISLLLVELFVIPGFGLPGILGIVAIAFSLLYSRLDFVWPRFEWQWDLFYRSLLWTLLGVIGSLVGIVLLFRFLPGRGPFRRLVLTGDLDEGLASAAVPRAPPARPGGGGLHLPAPVGQGGDRRGAGGRRDPGGVAGGRHEGRGGRGERQPRDRAAGGGVSTALVLGLLGAGVLAILAEIFIPAAGVIGIAGVASLAAGVVGVFLRFGPAAGTVVLVLLLALFPLLFHLYSRLFPRTFLGRRLILRRQAPGGLRSVPEAAALVGREGVSLTVLRPAGIARIDGRRLDVVADGGFVAPGRPVRVIRVDGGRVVVRALQKEVER